jgi:hypothetical protein
MSEPSGIDPAARCGSFVLHRFGEAEPRGVRSQAEPGNELEEVYSPFIPAG